MNCGEEIRVKDFWGSYAIRFIAQCEGRFLLISNSLEPRNGYMLSDWRFALRELVALTVPAKLLEKTYHAESTASGLYHNLPLTYPLSVKGLAALFAVPADLVREQLADLSVSME